MPENPDLVRSCASHEGLRPSLKEYLHGRPSTRQQSRHTPGDMCSGHYRLLLRWDTPHASSHGMLHTVYCRVQHCLCKDSSPVVKMPDTCFIFPEESNTPVSRHIIPCCARSIVTMLTRRQVNPALSVRRPDLRHGTVTTLTLQKEVPLGIPCNTHNAPQALRLRTGMAIIAGGIVCCVIQYFIGSSIKSREHAGSVPLLSWV